MLVFNCTKAAADFFTVTRNGKKISQIEDAPHKTIAESIQTPKFPSDVDPNDNGGFQWQWVVHCVSIKRKKYLLVMDYHSRFCITLLAGKKGEIYEFLNAFSPVLEQSFRLLAYKQGVDEVEIEACIDDYHRKVSTCAFHARGDRSVQAHLNDAAWHLERHCIEDGMLLGDEELFGFNLFMAQFPRHSKDKKGYFFSSESFVKRWQIEAQNQPAIDMDNVVLFVNPKDRK